MKSNDSPQTPDRRETLDIPASLRGDGVCGEGEVGWKEWGVVCGKDGVGPGSEEYKHSKIRMTNSNYITWLIAINKTKTKSLKL